MMCSQWRLFVWKKPIVDYNNSMTLSPIGYTDRTLYRNLDHCYYIVLVNYYVSFYKECILTPTPFDLQPRTHLNIRRQSCRYKVPSFIAGNVCCSDRALLIAISNLGGRENNNLNFSYDSIRIIFVYNKNSLMFHF